MNPPRLLRSGAVRRGGLAVASLGLSLLRAEAVLRHAGYDYVPLRIRLLNRSDWRIEHIFDDSHFAYDPFLIWRPKPGAAIFNAQGLRGPLLSASKAPGEYRILALGDSNTLGWQGEDGPNWPRFSRTSRNASG